MSKSATTGLLTASELALLVFGIVLVAGLVGEFFADHKKSEYPRFKKRKRLFEVLVIVGVMGELIADGGIFAFSAHLQTIAGLEVAQLNREAGDARREAAQARLTAANVESNNVALSQKVEVLRKANDELEAKTNPRAITIDQRDKFLRITKDWPKGPAPVFVGPFDSEADSYAWQIKKLLGEAHYGRYDEGIIRRYELQLGIWLPYPYAPIQLASETKVIFLLPTAESGPLVSLNPNSARAQTNVFPGMTIISERTPQGTILQYGLYKLNDSQAIPAMIREAFSAIGIPTTFFGIANTFTNGEWGILVIPKVR